MENIVAPCKDCTKRTITCHSMCKDYQKWKIDYAAFKQQEKEKESIDYWSRDYDSILRFRGKK